MGDGIKHTGVRPIARPDDLSITRFNIPSHIISELVNRLGDLHSMSEHSSSSGTKTGRPRGRRAAAKVPCDDCIARASEKNEGGPLELCEKCTATLHRPRRKQQEQPNVRRVRRQSNAIIDTAL